MSGMPKAAVSNPPENRPDSLKRGMSSMRSQSSGRRRAGAQKEQEPGLGLASDVVRIAEHDAAWNRLFEAEKTRILHAVRSSILDIEHVGSTAVPELPAKPIIDIAITLPRLANYVDLVEPLQKLDYKYMADFNIPGEAFFRKEDGSYHLHVLEQGSPQWKNYLLFRDHLREHPETRQQYQELKKDLAAQFAEDRPAYTRGKATFIESVLHSASDANE